MTKMIPSLSAPPPGYFFAQFLNQGDFGECPYSHIVAIPSNSLQKCQKSSQLSLMKSFSVHNYNNSPNTLSVSSHLTWLCATFCLVTSPFFQICLCTFFLGIGISSLRLIHCTQFCANPVPILCHFLPGYFNFFFKVHLFGGYGGDPPTSYLILSILCLFSLGYFNFFLICFWTSLLDSKVILPRLIPSYPVLCHFLPCYFNIFQIYLSTFFLGKGINLICLISSYPILCHFLPGYSNLFSNLF